MKKSLLILCSLIIVVSFFFDATPPSLFPSTFNSVALAFELPIEDITPPEIFHEQIITETEAGKSMVITAYVSDNVEVSKVLLRYKDINGRSYYQLMTPMELLDNSRQQYYGKIPAQDGPGTVEYLIEAWDTSENVARTKPYYIKITYKDVFPPIIDHRPVEKARANEPIVIRASVKDNIGIAKVTLHCWDVYGRYMAIEMKPPYELHVQGLYEGIIKGQPTTGTISCVRYYIEAQDTSENVYRTPTYNITIIGEGDTTPPAIKHNQIIKEARPNESIPIKAYVKDNVQVSEVLLRYFDVNDNRHTLHMTPYRLIENSYYEVYGAEIPAQMRLGKVRYFIEARDSSGNVSKTEYYTIIITRVGIYPPPTRSIKPMMEPIGQ